jgi:ADP-heptose:LPS heptosyltransferase
MKMLIEKAIKNFPDYQHVYLEGKNDFEKGDFLKHLEIEDNFNIQPCLPLDSLLDLTAKARLVVSPDTGIRNVAISTHTPTVGIFYSTVPFRYTPQDGRHYIVMNPSGSIPSNDQIISEITKALTDKTSIKG